MDEVGAQDFSTLTPVSDIPCGSIVLLGRYSARTSVTEIPPQIEWVKVSRKCEFISRYVIDFLIYDAEERTNVENSTSRAVGSNDYRTSNIFSFINSDEEYWYEPTHEYDSPPDRRRYHTRAYEEHPGFLFYFDDYEKASISGEISLPNADWFFGVDIRTFFKKHGSRAKVSTDALCAKGFLRNYKATSYAEFFILDADHTYVPILGRDGSIKAIYPRNESGIRPACMITPETVVRKCGDKIYSVVPFEVEHSTARSDSDLFNLLGISVP